MLSGKRKMRKILPTLCKLSLYSSVSPLPRATIMTLFLPKKNLCNRRARLNVSLIPAGCATVCSDEKRVKLKTGFYRLLSLPAVFPRRPDVFKFVVPHIGHGKYEQISVGVHTFPQLKKQTSDTFKIQYINSFSQPATSMYLYINPVHL